MAGADDGRSPSELSAVGPAAPSTLREQLAEWFGFADFLPGQEEAIARVVAGEDLLVVRPTGSGKSLCYQLPAVLDEPLTLVISPLISLMKDQVDQLNARHPDAATYINSSLDIDEQRRRLQAAVDGRHKLLYVAPERFRYNGFLRRLQEIRIRRFVVDEAHCISEWGHDFRPDYLHLREVLPRLGDPPLVALTATATIDVQRDIAQQLGRADMGVLVSGFNRPTLSFEVRYAVDTAMKWTHIERLLAELEGSGIIYAGTRKETEEVAEYVQARTERPVIAYHAGLESQHRTQTQDAFMASRDGIAVATNAFGMGIDKSDVRFVLHFSLPGTVEAYYQQAGRAGRDGGPARCILLYDPADRALQEWFIEQENLPSHSLQLLLIAVEQGAPDLTTLAARAGLSEIQARVGMTHLERLGCVSDRGPFELPRYELIRDRIDAAAARAHDERSRARRAMRLSQLEAMVRYAETATSRRAFLLGYFGDRSAPTEDELRRDDPPPPEPDPGVVTPEETEVGRLILETVDSLRYGVGRTKLAQILKGSKSQDLAEPQKKVATYGALDRWRNGQITAAVDHLVLTGLLKPVGGERPILALTTAGRAVLDDPRRLIDLAPLRLMAPVTSAAKPGKDHALRDVGLGDLSRHEKELYERLRTWRSEKARETAQAPYLVLTNRALQTLCRARPGTGADLLTVPGFGPAKVERYGAELLVVIQSWLVDAEAGVLGPEDAARPQPSWAQPAAPAAPAAPTLPPPPQPTERKAVVSDSARETLALIEAGNELEAVARERGLPATSLANEVTTLIAAGLLPPARLLGEETTQRITEVLTARSDVSLAEARRALGPEVSYNAIRWVRESLAKPAAPAPAAAPLAEEPALGGPWQHLWRMPGARPDIDALVAAMAAELELDELALIAVAGRDEGLAVLAARLSRRTGVPVSYGLLAADGSVAQPARVAEPLVLFGAPRDLPAAAAKLVAAGVARLEAVAVG